MTSVRLSPGELEQRVAAALVASRTAPDTAASVARALTQAEVDGQRGHGISRVPSYAAQAKAGKVDGFARPAIAATRPGALMIDVAHGFAYPAFDTALPALADAARANGIAAAAFHRSHHCGVAGWHVERLAMSGCVGLLFANTPKAMAAWGGKQALFGTNPIAFAAPRGDGAPLVVDLALSQVARGKILLAQQNGERIPAGWAVDIEGRATTDPAEALEGTLTPIGGAKGAALAIMVELLAVALTGAVASRDATSFFNADGAPPGVGQFMIAIAPGAFAGGATFEDRAASLFDAISSEPGVRLPGSRRLAARAAALRDGVAVDNALLAEIDRLAATG
jgi:(2R)-3-sulfolactate dehydrogenase (NADP+)